MSTEISKTEFLKRYLENEKKGKRKKKPKSSNPLVPHVKIIDENIDLKSIEFGEKEIEEKEEAPIIAEVIDDRPEEVKLKELYESSKWKKLNATNADPDGISASNEDKFFCEKNISSSFKTHKRHDSDSDNSLPRKTSSQSRYDSDGDISPLRNRPVPAQTKKRRHDSGSDGSPPSRQKSPLSRKTRFDSGSDISPPRKSNHHNERTNTDNRLKRHDSDSDLSPERLRPSKKNYNVKLEQNSDSDLSPPRIKDLRSHGSSSKTDSKKRPVKTLSGLKAGLQNAETLRKETHDLRDRERRQINQLDAELSGRSAETIVRDRKTGKRRDLEAENQERLEKEKKLLEQQQKYSEWGKGIEQTETKRTKLSEDLYESSKPFARYHGDDDLEEALKSVIHDDDPMAEFFKKKKKKENASVMPEYNGPPAPPNRFGIKPGYRWDGVDRFNGFEKKYFEKVSTTKAMQEEAYLWSVQDM